MTTDTVKYKALRPPLKSFGGSYYLAKRIRDFLPPRKSYDVRGENFGRGASVTLSLAPDGCREYWNDLDAKIFNLWGMLTKHTFKLQTCVTVPYTETVFRTAKLQDEQTPHQSVAWDSDVDDKHRMYAATWYFIRNRMSRGGHGKAFAWSDRLRGGQPGDVNGYETACELLPAIATRFTDVTLANGCGIFLTACQADEKRTFQFIDPPWHPDTRETKDGYAHEMSHDQHVSLLEACNACKGPVMLVGRRCEIYDIELGNNWNRYDFLMSNAAGEGKTKKRKTTSIWTNY
jgi:DNA adenine methylase